MPYDASKPADGSLIAAPELRGQFAGLKSLIDAVPAGPPGPPGTQGPPFANAVVDGTTTLDPGVAASVGVFFDGTDVHFSFSIPRGNEGLQGLPGPTGEVTSQQLTDAIAGTARNPNGQMGNLDPNWNPQDPPTADDLRWLRDRLVELYNNTAR